jgi:hypothetical protein
MYDVDMSFVIGMPNAGRFWILSRRPGEYLLAALFGHVPGTGLLHG